MDKLWDEYPVIKKDLEAVLAIMKKNTACKDKKIETSILDLIHSGGKLLRPALVLIGAHFGEFKAEKAHPTAAVIEMLHMATLVHDDIIDDSKLRRGQETVQAKYGKNYAVYVGDFLFCQCFKILADNSSLRSISIDSNSLSRICIGEVDQLSSKYDLNVTVKQYLKRISSKTGELFSLSLYTGAAESECDNKLCKNFWQIGHNIGMAFQIIDDILDYTGDDKTVGKSTSNDLKQGIFTLPLIYSIQTKNSELLSTLSKDFYSDKDIKRIFSIVKDCGGYEKSKNLAKRYTTKAYKQIDKLPENQYKYILMNITRTLLERQY